MTATPAIDSKSLHDQKEQLRLFMENGSSPPPPDNPSSVQESSKRERLATLLQSVS